jgi:hypothetical protein
MSQIHYYDLDTKPFKTATHAKFDEGMSDLENPTLHSRQLRDDLDGKEFPPECIESAASAISVLPQPFVKLKIFTLPVICDHPNFDIEVQTCDQRARAYIAGISELSTASKIRGWRRHYIGAYLVEFNGLAIYYGPTFNRACEQARTSILASSKPMLTLVVAPDRLEAAADEHNLPRMKLDQLHPILWALYSM